MSFLEGEIVIVDSKAKNGLPNRVGERAVILFSDEFNSPNYDYLIEFDDKTTAPVKESEIYKLTEEDKQAMKYIFVGNKVKYVPTNETVRILKVDYLLEQAEVRFEDTGIMIVRFATLEMLEEEIWRVVEQPEDETLGRFTDIAIEIGKFTDEKNRQYGSSVDATQKIMEVLMERYTYDEDNYLMPKSLLRHMLLQVRILDKINRQFQNPSGEGDSESPYRDITGYGLIGIDMVDNVK